MELASNGGLTGWGVVVFLAALTLSGVVIVPIVDRIVALSRLQPPPVPTQGLRRRRDDEWWDSPRT